MSNNKDRNQFTYVETEQTKGLIAKIDKIAASQGRKRNNWVGWVLSKIVKQEEENKDIS